MNAIYLDNNATTPLLPEVAEAMRACQAAGHANPASQHQAGRQARNVLETARESIAALLGADAGGIHADQVIFTSGGTEANNLALRGLAGGTPAHLVISAIEHPSVTGAADRLESIGWQVDRLPVNCQGVARVDRLPALLRSDTRLVSIMLGNNETGVLQPVREIAGICRERGVLLHTDATQVVGKLPVDFRHLQVDALTATAHKFHGPVGIGLLLVRHGVGLEPLLWGGFQQGGLRPGTEPVALAVGMQAALEMWHQERYERKTHLTSLRDQFEAALRSGRAEIVVHGGAAERLPHTSNISFPRLDRQMLLLALDQAGVACSAGSACASGSSEPSPALVAMGLKPELVTSALRFSFGVQNTSEEVAEAVERILRVCNDLQHRESARKSPLASPAHAQKEL